MKTILVTGASGYLGAQTVTALAQSGQARLIACDVRAPRLEDRRDAVVYEDVDVRSPQLASLFGKHKPDCVIHLASIVTPAPRSTAEFEYSVDVLGSENVLKACLSAGVKRIVVSSSGAAYGYHADNPSWLREEDALRGNDEFAYSRHKRLVEEMLARYRQAHPQLKQTIFRIGTILGERVRNQITALFDRKRILILRGVASPFVFVWDQDVVACLQRAALEDIDGIFNVAGDGALELEEIARMCGKPTLALSPTLLKLALSILYPLRLSPYGPQQLRFLQFRPVLDNSRLKQVFGYTPAKSSRQALQFYLSSRGMLQDSKQ
ncbi:MAG: SDR family oxidoreductase [Leptospirales bacterium]|nr:SDR family oxidoreductase [Leptospirales bacterium]